MDAAEKRYLDILYGQDDPLQELLAKNNLIALGVCALWIGAGYILFNLFYQRKGIDC